MESQIDQLLMKLLASPADHQASLIAAFLALHVIPDDPDVSKATLFALRNICTVALAHMTEGAPTVEQLTWLLQLEEQFVHGFVRLTASWRPEQRTHLCREIHATWPQPRLLFLNGAALPWFTKRSVNFRLAVQLRADHYPQQRTALFERCYFLFTHFSRMYWGEDFEVFPTRGTLSSFTSTISELFGAAKPTVVIGSGGEYLPMALFLGRLGWNLVVAGTPHIYDSNGLLEHAKQALEQVNH